MRKFRLKSRLARRERSSASDPPDLDGSSCAGPTDATVCHGPNCERAMRNSPRTSTGPGPYRRYTRTIVGFSAISGTECARSCTSCVTSSASRNTIGIVIAGPSSGAGPPGAASSVRTCSTTAAVSVSEAWTRSRAQLERPPPQPCAPARSPPERSPAARPQASCVPWRPSTSPVILARGSTKVGPVIPHVPRDDHLPANVRRFGSPTRHLPNRRPFPLSPTGRTGGDRARSPVREATHRSAARSATQPSPPSASRPTKPPKSGPRAPGPATALLHWHEGWHQGRPTAPGGPLDDQEMPRFAKGNLGAVLHRRPCPTRSAAHHPSRRLDEHRQGVVDLLDREDRHVVQADEQFAGARSVEGHHGSDIANRSATRKDAGAPEPGRGSLRRYSSTPLNAKSSFCPPPICHLLALLDAARNVCALCGGTRPCRARPPRHRVRHLSRPVVRGSGRELSARLAVADAAGLPFADGRFDRVVVYNVLMDVPDVPAALREASRVLTHDGVLTVSIVSTRFIDRGGFSGPEPDASFVADEPYFGSRHFTGREDRDGPPCTSRGGRGSSRTTAGPAPGWARDRRPAGATSRPHGSAPVPLRRVGPVATVSLDQRRTDHVTCRTGATLPDPGSAQGLLRVGAERSPVTAYAGPLVVGEGPQGPAPSPRALACAARRRIPNRSATSMASSSSARAWSRSPGERRSTLSRACQYFVRAMRTGNPAAPSRSAAARYRTSASS